MAAWTSGGRGSWSWEPPWISAISSRTAFGYGPKTLHQVLRFQRALRLARAGGRLSDVAAVVGYADQAHMARDTRRLAGVPITELL